MKPRWFLLPLVLCLFALCSCAALAPTPDPKFAGNAEDVIYFASKDKDPADAPRVAAAIMRARTMAEEAIARDRSLEARLDAIEKEGRESGNPVGQTAAAVAGVGALVLTAGKSLWRWYQGQPTASKLAELADTVVPPPAPAPTA
jgi:hypothetical protein